jgi:hypothetical protein
MGKRHQWGGMIADAKGYVRLSVAASGGCGGWERRRRAVKAACGGGVGDNGVVMIKEGFSSYVTCIMFLNKKTHNLLATC